MEDCRYDIHFQENRGARRDLKTVLGKYIKINEMKNRKIWLFRLKLVEVIVHLHLLSLVVRCSICTATPTASNK